MVRWTRNADLYIQRLWNNWKFLRAEFSQTTSQSDTSVAKPSGLKWWDNTTFKFLKTNATFKAPIDVVEYDSVKDQVFDTNEDTPSLVIIMPDNSLQLEPVPNNSTDQVFADYYLSPVPMVNNTDVSKIPEDFHNVILGRALILYGNYEHAPEQITQGKEIYVDFLARLENDELPNQFNSRFRTGAQIEVIASQ